MGQDASREETEAVPMGLEIERSVRASNIVALEHRSHTRALGHDKTAEATEQKEAPLVRVKAG